MKIGIVFPVRLEPHELHKAPGLLTAGFTALGHDARLISPMDGPLDDPARWRAAQLDIALVFTWMTGFPAVLAAIRASGTFVAQIGDTDGRMSARVYPRARLERMVMPQHAFADKARALGFWARTWASGFRAEDADVIANIESTHLTIVETKGARENIVRFLRVYGRSSLEAKIVVVPNPVEERLWREPGPKERLIVAIGRWDDPQKNVALLVRVLGEYLRKDPATRAEVMGSGGDEALGRLAGLPNFCRLGTVARETIAARLAVARVILFTSRWEGMAISLGEALTLGCTAVSTPLPTFEHILQPDFGAVAASRAEVGAALKREMRAWDDGHRDPVAIAQHFRALLAPRVVAARILTLAAERVQEGVP